MLKIIVFGRWNIACFPEYKFIILLQPLFSEGKEVKIMAEFSQISAKAAAITGAVLGFLCGLFSMGMVGMMGMPYAGMTMMGGAYAVMGWWAAIYGLVVGAIVGGLIAIIYNWALSLK